MADFKTQPFVCTDRITIFVSRNTKEQLQWLVDKRTIELEGKDKDGNAMKVYSYPTMGEVLREAIDFYFKHELLKDAQP